MSPQSFGEEPVQAPSPMAENAFKLIQRPVAGSSFSDNLRRQSGQQSAAAMETDLPPSPSRMNVKPEPSYQTQLPPGMYQVPRGTVPITPTAPQFRQQTCQGQLPQPTSGASSGGLQQVQPTGDLEMSEAQPAFCVPQLAVNQPVHQHAFVPGTPVAQVPAVPAAASSTSLRAPLDYFTAPASQSAATSSPSTSTQDVIHPAGKFVKFAPTFMLGPKVLNWQFETHMYDQQYNNYVLVRGDNRGSAGLTGVTVDYVDARTYAEHNFKNRPHVDIVPLNVKRSV